MLLQPAQRLDGARVRELVRAHPWATLVAHAGGGLLASHMPALIDEGESARLVLLSHTAAHDPLAEPIRAGDELLVVVQGEHGFLPGAWEGGSVGTWNFEAAHLHGVPEVLDRSGSLDLLRRTFEHLEARRAEPTPWADVAEIADRLVGGTCCFRLPVARVEAKAKLGQEKPPDARARLIAGLEQPGPYFQPALAELMRRTLP